MLHDGSDERRRLCEHGIELEAELSADAVEREHVHRIADRDGERAVDLEQRQQSARARRLGGDAQQRILVGGVARQLDARNAHLALEDGADGGRRDHAALHEHGSCGRVVVRRVAHRRELLDREHACVDERVEHAAGECRVPHHRPP